MAPVEDKNLLFLVVDDQFNVRRMVQNFLRTFGYTKTIDAPDGQKAWERASVEDVGFIICDWNMPVLNGLGFLRKVRADARLGQVPFLMVTAEVAEDIVAEAIEQGVDGYIVKPFQAKTLVDKVESILERRRNPLPVDIHLRQGAELMKRGLPQEALAEYNSALAINPQSPRSLVAVGEALEALGRDDEAEQCYLQAVALAKRFVLAHDRLGALYRRQKRMDLATAHLQRAAAVSPRNLRRQVEVGRVFLEQGEVGMGLAALKMVRDGGLEDAGLAEELGEMLLAAGLNDEAAQAFDQAVSLDPAKVHVYNRLGIAYRRQRRYADAIREYQRALLVKPDDENLFYNLAVAQAEAGKFGEARAALAQAIGLRPDFAEAKDLLVRLADR